MKIAVKYQLMMKNSSTEQEVNLYYEKKEFHLFNCQICMPFEKKIFLTNLYSEWSMISNFCLELRQFISHVRPSEPNMHLTTMK